MAGLRMRDARQAFALWAKAAASCLSVALFNGLLLACLAAATLLPGNALAAYAITSPSATLTWDSGATGANVIVTRYERIGLYRYDPSGSFTDTVFASHFASADSLTGGTPTTTTALPPALDDTLTPIPLNQPVTLTQTATLNSGETLFVVVDQPQLAPGSVGTRSDGRQILGVTLRVDNGAGTINDHIIALVETAPGSNRFIGYLPASGAGDLIPNGATVELLYDDYGDLADSQTTGTPYSVDAAVVSALNDRRFVGMAGTPPIVRGNGLFLSKQALRTQAAQGELVPYQLRIVNSEPAAIAGVVVTDILPEGFRLRSKSVIVDGVAVSATVAADGRTITIPVGNMAADQQVSIDYVADVTALAQIGPAINQATARDSGTLTSNTARAAVQVEQAFFNDRAFLMGRVIIGECGDRTGAGMKNVRLYMEDGSTVMTDAEGRFHFEGIKPGTHVLQVDEDSLGPRYSLQRCDTGPRSGGNRASRFVELQGGTLWREEFFLAEKPLVSAHIQQQLLTEVSAGQARLRLPIGNGETTFERLEVKLYLPDSLVPEPGSTALDGKPVADPVPGENYYLLELTPTGKYWAHEITLTLTLDPGTVDGDRKSIMAQTTGITQAGKRHSVVSYNEVGLIAAQMQDAVLTLRPQFPTMSAELSEQDRLTIKQAAEFLGNFHAVELDIVGHTDAVPVRQREGRLINSNQSLSEARAQAVADELSKHLSLADEAVRVSGRGQREPVADNNTDAGRAMNRRVEIRIRTRERVRDAALELVIGDSGLSQASDREKRAEERSAPGIHNLRDGMKLSLPVISVSGSLDPRLKPRLMLNDEEVPSSRMAMKLEDKDANLIHYTWLGIELPETGDYRLELQGVGPFGNARYRQTLALTRTSGIKAVLPGDAVSNIADGKTPVRVPLKLLDQSGRSIASRTDLTLLSGQLEPLDSGINADRLSRQRNVVEVDADGIAWFEPVSQAGTYRIRLGDGNVASDTIEVRVDPEMRDWILVGYAKGTAGYSTLEDNIEQIPDAEEDVYTDGEAAFFAKGRIRGDWLLTMAYDSRKEKGDSPLGGQFSPDQWYVLYGDNTERTTEAASQEKLYLRIERRQFYALFGDYETGLSVTELSRYQRTLTGFKSEYRGRYLSSTLFAAQTSQGFLRADLPGDGTSGLYRIGRGDILPGSEVVRIETRDRFNNELLSSESRNRFVDYSLDYQDGTLYFREPIPVQDADFNPVFIVIEYEVENGEESMTGGGRVALHDEASKVELGVTGVSEGTRGEEAGLSGVDLTWRPDDRHTVKFEAARTEQNQLAGAQLEGSAWLAEHRFLSERLDTRIRLEAQEAEFGLGQQAASESGNRQASSEARYRISEQYVVSGEVRRQERLDADETRDSVEGRIEYDRDDWKLYGGLRSARDEINGTVYQSDLLTAGARRSMLDKRLTLSATGETLLSESDQNNDYPHRIGLDADYRITRLASVFAAQEFAWGEQYHATESRAGIRSTPWKGGSLTTDVGHQQDEFGPRTFAHAGLYQTLHLNNHWTADAGLDRAQTVHDGRRSPSFDEGQRPPASGTNNNDYTAVALGLGYRDSDWQWTNRLEHRLSEYSDKWNLFSGLQHRLSDVNTLLGRVLYRVENIHGGADEWRSELDLSLVHRPHASNWWLVNRGRFIVDGLEDRFGERSGQRLVNNLAVNYAPGQRHQTSFMYGARYVLETVNAEDYTGYSDLLAAEYRFNLSRHWDLGARASSLNSWSANVRDSSYGVMVGVSPVQDVWISLGYNFKGFYDADFDQAGSRVAGVVLDFRIKFDQDSPRRWRGGE